MENDFVVGGFFHVHPNPVGANGALIRRVFNGVYSENDIGGGKGSIVVPENVFLERYRDCFASVFHGRLPGGEIGRKISLTVVPQYSGIQKLDEVAVNVVGVRVHGVEESWIPNDSFRERPPARGNGNGVLGVESVRE